MVRPDSEHQRELILNAAETVVRQRGLNCLTLDAVAAAAGLSKGGLLHHFPNKDSMIEGLVQRSADGWRECYTNGFAQAQAGPGRQVRGLLDHCLTDAKAWTKELQTSTSACFSALIQNPELIGPMRDAYTELHERVANDGLPPGVGEAIAAALDGLWLYWVLGLADVNQDLVARVRKALENMLEQSLAAQNSEATKVANLKSPGGQNV